MKRVLPLVALLAALAGCRKPTEGPGAAALRYLSALVERDAQVLYSMLDPTSRDRIAKLHNKMKETRDLIIEHYPEASREDALRATGTGSLGHAPTPDALFEALVTRAGERASLSRLQRFGLRVKSTEMSDGGATVTTLGGDVVETVEIGGEWYVALGLEDATRLQQLETRAERNLDRVRQQVAALRKHRFGGAGPN